MQLHFVLPGPLTARTGGTIYDRRVVEALRDRGHVVSVHGLDGTYPEPDANARDAAAGLFASIPDGALTVVDGLAFGALPEVARGERGRLRLVALVHHPLRDETGLEPEAALRHAADEEASLACAKGVVATSAFTLERLRALGWLPDGLLVAASVEPGVDPAPLAPAWSIGQPFHLVSVGSVTPRKAHLDAIEALGRLTHHSWRWTVAGREDLDRHMAHAVRGAIQANGLAERVTLLGEVDDAHRAALLHSAHALLHPARYEGYGMVILEAIAHGLPVVASTGGALRTTVPPGAGWSFEPGDIDALERALRSAMTDFGAYAARRVAATEARAHGRSWQDVGAEFERLLECVGFSGG